MDQTQTSDDAPLLTHSTPQSEQTTLLAQQKPLVTIVHASVGSGHKAAAKCDCAGIRPHPRNQWHPRGC